MEEFKRQRKEGLKSNTTENIKADPQISEENNPETVDAAAPVVVAESFESLEKPKGPDAQTEISLDEPPAESGDPIPEVPAFSERQLNDWWNEFAESQSMRISSLLKTLKPVARGNEVVVQVPPKKDEITESVKYPFARFITEKSKGALTKLAVEEGVLENTGKRPYTEKEKLEYLRGKHPEMEEVIKKLGLFIP